MNINRLLVANRGEIAARIIRTCHDLGIETVLAASEADLDSIPARMAGSVICLGPPPSSRSYLNIEAVMAAARQAEVDAIHPGYGFLSENAALASACEADQVIFIGPTIAQLDAIGDKLKARANALEAGLPVVPGGSVTNVAEAQQLASDIGYPVLIKAVSGGGGRGMKVVHDPAVLADTMNLAQAEAENAFGDARIYLECYVASGRHVEVQVLGDGQEVVHLGTRDCSIQRRYQKLVEEAPAPHLDDTLREAMHEAAIAFARHLDYRGAGTLEFLVDTDRNSFYFLEMNARIQVEHPVTEAITGIDLVAQQIRVAEGRPLGMTQDDISFYGHAIECRLNAEDCLNDFQPSPGHINRAVFPAGEGIRLDSHVESGVTIPPFYDSLLGKLITWGNNRDEAVSRMQAALTRCQLQGIESNLVLHRAILADTDFVEGGVDTQFLPARLASGSWQLAAGQPEAGHG